MTDVAALMGDSRPQLLPRDREIAALADSQHGVVARRQLIGIGIGSAAIQHWLRGGRLHQVHRAVYAVGHNRLTREGRWTAAVLACGTGAVLTHRSAAALVGIRRSASPRIEVTVPGRGRRGPKAITVHAVRHLDPRDCMVVDAIPTTTVARTLFDCAEVLSLWQLERAFEESERLRVFDLRALEAVCQRNPGRHAHKVVRRLLKALREPPATRSELERLFLDFCRAFGLPEPVFNAVVGGYEVDAWWPGTLLIVELDSFGYHSSRRAFEADRERDIELKLKRFEVLRVTDRRIKTDGPRLARQIATLLERATSQAAPSSPIQAA